VTARRRRKATEKLKRRDRCVSGHLLQFEMVTVDERQTTVVLVV